MPLSSFPGGSGARVARGSVPASVFTFAFPGGPACAFPVPAVTDGRGPGQMTADRGHKRQNLSRFRQPEVQNRGVGRAVLRLGAPGRCQSSPPSARGGLRLRWRVAASPRLLPPVPGRLFLRVPAMHERSRVPVTDGRTDPLYTTAEGETSPAS